MREILFRGKRTDNGEWIEGFYAISGDRTYIILDSGIAFAYVTMKEVLPETVGEFTGLTDKNGKKIFEGDIVKDIDGRFYRICLFEYEWFADLSTSIGISMKNLKPCEIIGNIFENPELLEGVE